MAATRIGGASARRTWWRTPEPTLATLKKAYPPGTYRWSGRAVDGRRLRGTSRLRYKLLAAPVITSPSAGQNGLPTRDGAVTWQRVPGAATIHLEVETEELHRVLTVDFSGDATSFVIPDGFRLPNRPYVLDIKAVAPNGNLTVSDLKCHTG